MDEDKLAFLDGNPEEEASTEEEQQPAEQEATEQAEPDKASDEGTGEKEQAEPPSAEPEESQHAPIKALLDEREKRQTYQKKAEELERRLQQLEQQKPQQKPDFWENPEQALSQVQQQVQQQIINERLNFSERLARREHGAEVVDQASKAFQEAAQSDPSLRMQLQRSEDPYSFVVSWHKRNQFLSEIGDDPDAWKAQQREALEQELREKIQAEMQQSKPSAPPQSLARAPSAGADTSTAPGSAFDQLFGD